MDATTMPRRGQCRVKGGKRAGRGAAPPGAALGGQAPAAARCSRCSGSSSRRAALGSPRPGRPGVVSTGSPRARQSCRRRQLRAECERPVPPGAAASLAGAPVAGSGGSGRARLPPPSRVKIAGSTRPGKTGHSVGHIGYTEAPVSLLSRALRAFARATVPSRLRSAVSVGRRSAVSVGAASAPSRRLPFGVLASLALAACRGEGQTNISPRQAPAAGVAKAPPRELPPCPAVAAAPDVVPGSSPRQRSLQYWLERWGNAYDLDEVLLSSAELDRLEASAGLAREGLVPRLNLLQPPDMTVLRREVRDRLEWAEQKLTSGQFVGADGQRIEARDLVGPRGAVRLAAAEARLHVALADAQLHCAPLPASFYAAPAPGVSIDRRLDRNACSRVRAQEVVRVVAQWPNGMRLAQAAYSFGWLAPGAELSPPVPSRLREAIVASERLQVARKLGVGATRGEPELVLSEGTLVASLESPERSRGSSRRAKRRRSRADESASEAPRAIVATARGFVTTDRERADHLRFTRRGLTRRALLQQAFRYIEDPYGLGGSGGGRDCSRLIMDAFSALGVDLPRHSSWQANAASFQVDLQGVDEKGRLLLMDSAARRGIVLLYFPGHIMLYLGRDESGEPRVLHALGEYVQTCEGHAADRPRETLMRVEKVAVSGLRLGEGSSRRALLERITSIAVIGRPPGPELAGVARMRPPAPARIPADRECRDSRPAALYALPERPNVEQPLRVVAALEHDPGPARMILVSPAGELVQPELVRLGGPPFGQVAMVAQPRPGRYKAVIADGDEVLACQRVTVYGRRPKRADPSDGPVWNPRWGWSRASENFFSLFVERLFDHPADEDVVWENLHTLLRDPDRNLLFDYRGLKEDAELELVPDCADLPYTLRAYFAWKMRMPFGFRRCTRARDGKPPNCAYESQYESLITNVMSRLELKSKEGRMLGHDDVEAFSLFVQRHLRGVVHSSSGRTLPGDDATDFYPIGLSRESLRPGSLFADPYGHLLVVADWRPQGKAGYGVLVGVDAQPDGTIGRRRFWRGSFLFDPSVESGGAGFKAFRPRKFVREPTVVDPETGAVVVPSADAGTSASREPGSQGAPRAQSANVSAALPIDMDSPAPVAAASPEEPPSQTVTRIGFLEELTNEDLQKTGRFTRYSDEQYRGSLDDFYDRVEAQINPRPLDAEEMQVALLDALAEAVSRRVTSVENAEKWHAAHPEEVIEMPDGAGIFLSAGPWEDFSTPSRDLRLLISIDSVVGFGERVERAPRRFGIEPSALAERVGAVRAVLRAGLASRSVQYRRSDGSTFRLTLEQLVDRAGRFEMAYNPNDCVELRWGAEPGSDEASPCSRRAPDAQRERMSQYRPWFASRKRPAR